MLGHFGFGVAIRVRFEVIKAHARVSHVRMLGNRNLSAVVRLFDLRNANR